MNESERGRAPSRTIRLTVVAILALALGGVLWQRAQHPAVAPATATATEAAALPLLIDLGADKCVPCKMMAPILAQLETDLAGQLTVRFIDVWKNPEEGPKYGISSIPTQIFLDPQGRELFRHVGFFSREDILATWAEHGYAFTVPATAAPADGV